MAELQLLQKEYRDLNERFKQAQEQIREVNFLKPICIYFSFGLRNPGITPSEPAAQPPSLAPAG